MASLEEKQEEMRARMLQRQIEAQQEVRICSICNRRRCRKGSPFCSRCTIKGTEEKLRDTLPGAVINITPPPPPPPPVVATGVIIAPPPPPPIPPPTDQIERQYTRKEASRMIGVSVTTLIRWEQRQCIPLPRHVVYGNRYIYTESQIEEIKRFKDSEIIGAHAPRQRRERVEGEEEPAAGTLDAFAKRRGKKFAAGKGLEKSVARQLGSLGRKTGLI